ncbi:hypothetical protein GE061_007805 [Apolygus lucorum]|uniref:Peptidase S1 domain-containing protein n=1 Tax=Apolygus lucorum TaxID=248454 RepID=A0A8S9WPF2_APOLU|nr:hypothetical protein GE061_007805 [Apolygus lucorum]
MYAQAFLLFFIDFLTTGALASDQPSDQSWAQERYEKEWQNGGGERQDEQPDNFHSRRKREEIPDEYVDEVYKPSAYYGDRSTTIMSIENKHPDKYDNDDLGQTYGVRIQNRLVLTVCSAVTYMPQLEYRVLFAHHYQKHLPVTKVKLEDITVQILSTEKTEKMPIIDIKIHPSCDNQYLVDLAVLMVKDPLPGTRAVWIHTAENLLFRRNLDRVVSASAVLGRCSVPVFRSDYWNTKLEIAFVNINFQHWGACRSLVCQYWQDIKGPVGQDAARCDNLLNGTRLCMRWDVPISLCNRGMGTPVFCDVGNIHGLMGFIVSATYRCFTIDYKDAIMQGVSDGINWLRKTIGLARELDYEKEIPPWMRNLRQSYAGDWTPVKVDLNKPPPDPQYVEYKNFLGSQVFSVVNVYHRNGFRCRGALVTHEIALLPCSCLLDYQLLPDMSDPVNIVASRSIRGAVIPATELLISLMVNHSYPQVPGVSHYLDPECDSLFSHDSAYLRMEKLLPKHKIAWVMTTQINILKKMLYITSVADASMGYNCYWLNNEIPKPYYYFRKSKIRFAPWTSCTKTICPNEAWLKHQEERCFGASEPMSSSLFCIESLVKNTPACGLAHGTPIYCNVEQARGLIGYVSLAYDMEFNTTCYERDLANQGAVMVSIDQILPDISNLLWIDAVEKRLRARADYYEEGQSGNQLLEASFTLMFAVFIIHSMPLLYDNKYLRSFRVTASSVQLKLKTSDELTALSCGCLSIDEVLRPTRRRPSVVLERSAEADLLPPVTAAATTAAPLLPAPSRSPLSSNLAQFAPREC